MKHLVESFTVYVSLCKGMVRPGKSRVAWLEPVAERAATEDPGGRKASAPPVRLSGMPGLIKCYLDILIKEILIPSWPTHKVSEHEPYGWNSSAAPADRRSVAGNEGLVDVVDKQLDSLGILNGEGGFRVQRLEASAWAIEKNVSAIEQRLLDQGRQDIRTVFRGCSRGGR